MEELAAQPAAKFHFWSGRDGYPRPQVKECLSARLLLVPRTRGASDVLESPSDRRLFALARLLAA